MKKTTTSNWQVNSIELRNQIENYKTLKINQSARGVAVLLVGSLLALSFLFILFGVTSFTDMAWGLIIYVPILFFVYKGHRWAMVFLMVFFTIDKVYTYIYLSEQHGYFSPISSIIFLVLVVSTLYRALVVENKYRKYLEDPSNLPTIDQVSVGQEVLIIKENKPMKKKISDSTRENIIVFLVCCIITAIYIFIPA